MKTFLGIGEVSLLRYAVLLPCPDCLKKQSFAKIHYCGKDCDYVFLRGPIPDPKHFREDDAA